MALVTSSIASVCKSLADYLGGHFSGTDTPLQVLLGSPGDAAASEQEAEHRLNLFFFRFEPSGFGADGAPGDTQYLRMHCLVTPFAVSEESIGSGENDLRIIGEVLRIFQEKPVFHLDVEEETFHLQVMFQTLGMDQINQIWSTQGDTIYRPSVLYEVSLAPVIPRDPRVEAPLAGALGLDVAGRMVLGPKPVAVPPPVRHWRPDLQREDWAPVIAWVYDDDFAQSLNFALGSEALDDFTPRAWVAGEPGTEVSLVWEVWEADSGWQQTPGEELHTLGEAALDPDTIGSATLAAPTLPFRDRAGQLVLYAQRDYQRSSDGQTLTRRSNPLMINLYEADA